MIRVGEIQSDYMLNNCMFRLNMKFIFCAKYWFQLLYCLFDI